MPVLVDGIFAGNTQKDADASLPQWLLFRALTAPTERFVDRSVWTGELDAGNRPARPPNSESRQRSCARRPLDRPGRRRSDQLSLSEFRPKTESVYRRCPTELQPLFRQALRWSLRLGRRGLLALVEVPSKLSTIKPENFVGPTMTWAGRRRCWCIDHRLRAHLHRRCAGQFPGIRFERWQNAVACGLRRVACKALPSPTNSMAANMCL